MLAAALRDGTAHRRTTFEVFARRLPEGRRYGVVAGTARFVEALAQFRFDDAALASLTDFLDGRHAGVPRRLPVQRRRRRLRRGRAVLPRLAGAVGARHLRRMRGAGDAGAVDLQPRHRDRVGRRPHGQRRRGPPADRDGLAAHPRAGRRRRRPRRLHRRLRRLVQPGGPAPLRRAGAGHQRARVHAAAHHGHDGPDENRRRSAPRSTRSASAPRCSSTPTTSPRAWPTPSRWQAPSSARCASTPATSACWPARCATNSTASAPPKTRIVVSGDLDEFAIAALRAEPVDMLRRRHVGGHRLGRARPRAWSTSWSRWTACRWRSAAATRNPTAAASRRTGWPRPSGTIVEEVVHPARRAARAADLVARAADGPAGPRGRAGRATSAWPRPATGSRDGAAQPAVGRPEAVARRAGDPDPHGSVRRPRRLGGATAETAPVTELLARAVAALGGSERTRPDRDGRGGGARLRHRRAPRGAGGHRDRQVAGLPGARDRAGRRPPTNPSWCRRRPSRCSASSSTATCPAGRLAGRRTAPRAEFALLKGRGNYLCLNKIHNGSATEPDDRPQEELFEPIAATALGPRRAAADRVVVGDRHRRPRRADARRAGPVVVAGQRVGAGVHRRGPLPVRHRLLRREGPRQGRPAPTSSSPTTPCWPSTPSPTPPCCPNTNCSSSTRRTNSSTG